MKTLIAAAAAFLAATPALAAAQPSTPATAPAAPAEILDGNTPIETLMDQPAAKELVLKHFPDLDKHPAFDMFKAISLRDLAPMSEGSITEEKIVALEADLKALKS